MKFGFGKKHSSEHKCNCAAHGNENCRANGCYSKGQKADHIHCPHCGHCTRPNMFVCPHCGRHLVNVEERARIRVSQRYVQAEQNSRVSLRARMAVRGTNPEGRAAQSQQRHLSKEDTQKLREALNAAAAAAA